MNYYTVIQMSSVDNYDGKCGIHADFASHDLQIRCSYPIDHGGKHSWEKYREQFTIGCCLCYPKQDDRVSDVRDLNVSQLEKLRSKRVEVELYNTSSTGQVLVISPNQRKIGVFISLDLANRYSNETQHLISLDRGSIKGFIEKLLEIEGVAEEISQIVFKK